MADPLDIVIRARNEASAVLGQVGDQITGLGTIAGVAGAAMAAGLAAGVAAAIKSAGDLQAAVANISTIKPTIDTSQVFTALNEISTRVPQSASALADGLYNIFSSLDVSQEEALSLVETFAKGATGAQTTAETFGTSVIGVMNAYKLSVSDAAHISDVFFNTVNAGVISGQELASTLGPVTQSAKLAGVSFDELGGMIAGVTKEGGPAAQNVNNLNNLLMKVTTKEAQKNLNDLGIATIDAAGNFRPVMDVLGDLKVALGNLSQAGGANALQKIFPDAQARTAAATLISQLDFVNGAIETNKNQAGSAADAYKKMSETVNAQFTLMKNQGIAALTQIGGALLPLVSGLLSGAAAFTPAITANINAFATALGAIVGLLMNSDPNERIKFFNTLATVIDPGLAERIALITSGIIGLFAALTGDTSGLERLQNALAGLFGSGAAEQIMAIGGAIGGLISTVAGAVGQFVGWQDILVALGILLTVVVVPALLSLIGTIAPIIAIFAALVVASATLRAAWENDFGGIRTTFETAWNTSIRPGLQLLVQWLSETLPTAVNEMKTGWQLAWPIIQGVTDVAGKAIVLVFQTMKSNVDTFIGIVKEIHTAMEELRSFLAGLNLPNPFAGLAAAAGGVKNAVDNARGAGGGSSGGSSGASSGSADNLGAGGGGGTSLEDITPRATGGPIVPGRKYLVHRDEVITTQAAGFVNPATLYARKVPEITLGNIVVNPVMTPDGSITLESFTDSVQLVAAQVSQMIADGMMKPGLLGT